MVKNLLMRFRELFLLSNWVPQTFLFVKRVPRSEKGWETLVYIMKERKQIIKIDSYCFISAYICVKVLVVVVNSYIVFSVDDICRLLSSTTRAV